MTKDIKQIQEENRKLIVEAEFRGNKAWTKDEQEDLIAHFIKFKKERALAHTLLALGKIKTAWVELINLDSKLSLGKQ